MKPDRDNPSRLKYILVIENLVNDLLKLTLYINQQEVEVLLIHPFKKGIILYKIIPKNSYKNTVTLLRYGISWESFTFYTTTFLKYKS